MFLIFDNWIFLLFTAIGWTISAFGILQLPLWAVFTIIYQKGDSPMEKIRAAFRPKDNWGPKDPATLEKYKKYVSNFESSQVFVDNGFIPRLKRHIFG